MAAPSGCRETPVAGDTNYISAARIGRIVALHVWRGNYDIARQFLDHEISCHQRAGKELAFTDPLTNQPPTLEELAATTHISEFCIPIKTCEILERWDLTTVLDLIVTPDAELLQISRLGLSQLQEIRRRIKESQFAPLTENRNAYCAQE